MPEETLPPPTGRPERNRRRLTLVSLAANLILGAVWIAHSPFSPARGSSSLADSSSRAGDLSGPTLPSSPSGTGSGISHTRSKKGTPWSRLDSSDPRLFAANLRRAGCPEETICDLVRPRIERFFAARRAQVGTGDSFWATGRTRSAIREKNEAEIRALELEQTQWLSELACPLDLLEKDRSLDTLAMVEVMSGFLDPPTQAALLKLLAEQSERHERQRSRYSGAVELPEERTARLTEEAAVRKRLGQILNQSNREELDLRLATLASLRLFDDDTTAKRLNLSAHEVREFVRLQSSRVSRTLEELLQLSPGPAPAKPSESEVESQVRTLLGESRFALYQRLNDGTFTRIESQAASAHLSPDLAEQTYQIYSRFAAELAPLREAWSTDPATARSDLQAWREAQRQRLATLLSGLPESDRKDLLYSLVEGSILTAWRQP